jgi:RimJ/RimL family protein N-acetyltransferase
MGAGAGPWHRATVPMRTRHLPAAPDLTVRPIDAADQDALLDLFERLSPRSRLRRFLAPKPSLSRRELVYLTDIDHRTHEALAAVDADGAFVGVARYACAPGETDVADVAFAVADARQGEGIGTGLARLLVDDARANGITRLQGMTLPENRPARKLLGRMGFRVSAVEAGVLELFLDLAGGEAAGPAAA